MIKEYTAACGCKISTTENSSLCNIEYCRLHSASKGMYEALGTIIRTAESSGDDVVYLKNCLKTIIRIAKEAKMESGG